jgi:MerR family copper efflux transcriptional regulator
MDGVSPEELTIGELAAAAGIAPHVLRHWESMGLLTPPRSTAGRRRYAEPDRERVKIIQLGKRAGLSLEEIRQLLGGDDLAQRRTMLAGRRGELLERIAAAQRSVEMLDHAISCTHADITECPAFRRGLDLRST